MLTALRIRNLAVIDAVELALGPGFSVLSGETGAGKSILIDALGLLLGDRASNAMIRKGSERAELAASFALQSGSAARVWLAERDLDDPDDPQQLQLRRTLVRDGQGKATINGEPVPVRQLRELGSLLVEIYGQHEHQSLLRPVRQRAILDGYGGHEKPLAAVGDAHRALERIAEQIRELDALGDDGEQRSELLRYQLQELDELAPEDKEFEALEAEFRRLSHGDSVLADAAAAIDRIYEGDGNAYEAIATALRHLQNAAEHDPAFAEAAEIATQAEIAAKEAAHAAQNAIDGVEQDPERLAQLSARLDAYQNLARKHRVEPGALAEFHQQLGAELERLDQADSRLAALREQRDEGRRAWRSAAAALSECRQAAARDMAQTVTEVLQPLGLPHAQFGVSVRTDSEAAPCAHGSDSVEFQVTMNPGQPAAALSKVASGGELSRTGLALQVVCLDQSPVPVLLFDEVDAGIGGAVAEVVGRRLKSLGERYQVMCVTHQPQVAALATGHLRVHKDVRKGETFTRIDTLDDAQRVEELSRMLGGLEITEQTAAHAREMLERAATA